MTFSSSLPFQPDNEREDLNGIRRKSICTKHSNGEEDLPEVRQVVFVKVHKAASSTVQNILLRFAMARNLSVLLPKRGSILGEVSVPIDRRNVVPHPEGKDKFDILCNHVVYNREEIDKYFPQNVVRIAILREPLQQTLSALKFYSTQFPLRALLDGVDKHAHDAINGFLRHPEDFYDPSDNKLMSFVNNRMSLDLGFNAQHLDESKKDKKIIRQFVKHVEEEFDLVLISDYFDESMILFRRYLRWPMKDLIHLKVNTAQKHPSSSPFSLVPQMTPEIADAFRAWNRVDYGLYEYFLPVFLKTIQAEPRFDEELQTFRVVQEKVANFCLKDNYNMTLNVSRNIWTDEFTVSKSDCKLMMTPEIPLVELVKRQQLYRYFDFRFGDHPLGA
ncbi:galactose-3-O-sulfotransferase 3 [Elysia marginata]|uniref:Galactose-3-O-sulfotransferase 3 n=1 Tax=Elysia marginata TaxID=1093978 RepID=A0AAV4HU60_9GAST|nr:galactose-3-O-sulfotransferase 3 [Elysia marginata]